MKDLRVAAAIGAGGLLLALLVLAANGSELGDYTKGVAENNSAPAIAALSRGDLAEAMAVQPAMGWVSLLWRAPFAALAGGDHLWAYRLGTLACLLVVVALATTVGVLARRGGRGAVYVGLVVALLVATPPALSALHYGHPEELLGGALAVLAVIAGMRGRPWLAAVLLGLAIGNKHWALVVAAPVLLAVAPHYRLRVLLLGGAVAALFIVPGALGDPARYAAVQESLSSTQRVYPESVWFPVSVDFPIRVELGAGEVTELLTYRLPFGLRRGIASMLTLLIAAAAFVVLARRRAAPVSPLALLALLFALRCALDPMNLGYYATPALLAFIAWEALDGPPGRLPSLSVAVTGAYCAVWLWAIDVLPTMGIFLAWAASMLVLMAPLVVALRPGSDGARRPALRAPAAVGG